MDKYYVDQALFELYLEQIDSDLQKIDRNSKCLERYEAVMIEMRAKYIDFLYTDDPLTPIELEMLHALTEADRNS